MALGERAPSPTRPRAALVRARRERARTSLHDGAAHPPLEELQSARILSAVFDVAAQHGALNMSVANIVERAGVSRRTFYEIFSDREACLLAAFRVAVSHASARVLPAFEAQRAWPARIRAGLIELLGFFEEQPLMARLLVVESAAGGAEMQLARAEVFARLTSAIDEGRKQNRAGVAPSSLTAESVVGGALSVIHARIAQERNEPLLGLTNPLMSMIVLPYLGPGAARRELERPAPPTPSGPRAASRLLSDPFKAAGMRLTYRTVRVLSAVAEHPGASNRIVGEQAGIADQGQISKLLARLARAGLIANTGMDPGQGGSNAWTLTEKGRQVTQTVRAHTQEPK